MVDLKDLKWDELTFIEMPERDMSTKVRCTFRRAVPGSYRPDNSKCLITDLPKSWYDEFFQKSLFFANTLVILVFLRNFAVESAKRVYEHR